MPETPGIGRITGGGGQIDLTGDVHVTRGFTLHCDIELANNLEINWAGDSWHIDKLLDWAECIDGSGSQPRAAAGPGGHLPRLGLGKTQRRGGILRRVLVPGRRGARRKEKNDRAEIMIWAPGATPCVDPPVLTVPFVELDHGNLQFH